MNAVSLALVLVGVLLSVAAQLLLKAGTNAIGHFEFHWQNAFPIGIKMAMHPAILAGIACSVIGLTVWIMALSRVPVSIAYPMLSIGYLINAIAAWAWLDEPLGGQSLLGIGFIILGVWLIARP
ncbi:MAG: EamA family transporter [Rhodocyclaceae bacterium]